MSMENTWQGIEVTPAVHDWLAERGYSTHRMNKRKDAESIVGPELLAELEAAELRLLGFEVRANGRTDPAAFVLKDEHEPGVNPVSLLLQNDDFQMALSLMQPLFENALSNIIQSQMDPQMVIAEAGQIAAAARPLKRDAPSVLAEASKLARARLQATSRATNPQELERANALLIEYLKSTHFVSRAIRADEDSGDILSAAQARMMNLIEPSIQQVPEDTAAHLAELVTSVVTEIVEDAQPSTPQIESKAFNGGRMSTGGNTMANFPIPQAEYSNPKSDRNVTPRLREIVRRTTFLAPTPNPAPVVRRSVISPVAPGGSKAMDQINSVIAQALAPLVADLNALKARGVSVTRSASRRAIAPQISRQAAQAAVSGGPSVVIRTVESNAHGGLPTRRRVYSPAQVARRSTGMGLTERSSAPRRPAAYPSRYQPSSTFATAEARNHFDAQFENRPVGVVTPVHARFTF